MMREWLIPIHIAMEWNQMQMEMQYFVDWFWLKMRFWFTYLLFSQKTYAYPYGSTTPLPFRFSVISPQISRYIIRNANKKKHTKTLMNMDSPDEWENAASVEVNHKISSIN